MNYPSTNLDSMSAQLKAICLICCMGILAFYGTLHSPFHYDDAHAIVENPYIKDIGKFQEKVGIQNIFNRSVLLLSFAFNQNIGKLEVFGYHLFNILIHILSAILWFFLVKEFIRLDPSGKQSWIKKLPLACSIIHLVNPLNIQAITYISSRSSLLATFFYLLAFYIFTQTLNLARKNSSKLRISVSVFFFLIILFLGLGTKEIVASLPIMAIVYLWLATPVEERNRLIPKIISIFSLLLLFLAYRFFQQGNLFSLKADPTSGDMPRLYYFLTQLKVITGYYLLKLLAPFNLNFEPDIVIFKTGFHWGWFMGLIILLFAAATVYRHNSNLIKFGALWFFITILPTSSFIPLKQLATEHRTYLPGLGFSLILGWVFLNIRYIQAIPKILFIIFILLTSAITLNRSLDFRSEISLWEDTAQKSPGKALVQNNLATAYMGTNQLEKAEAALEAALAIKPLQIDSHVNLGHIAGRQKDWEKAIEKFDFGIALGTKKADTYYYSGFARNNLGRYEDAIPYFKKALSLKPFKADYHFDLGNSYKALKLFDSALHHFRKTLEIDPNHYKARNNMGAIFWTLGALDQAKVEFKKVLKIKSDIPAIHNNLAAIYIKSGDFKNAIPHLETLLKLQPENNKAKKLLQFSRGQIQ
ncbi:MAG: tetratricopeptide repeat protein [Nitrospinae bacterium]|nr:tetratricopeptide repeat protein [Nitrospinota bacterium]